MGIPTMLRQLYAQAIAPVENVYILQCMFLSFFVSITMDT